MIEPHDDHRSAAQNRRSKPNPPPEHRLAPTEGFLPELPRIRWEPNRSGGWEAWHVPPGAQRRKGCTYLGYVGKKLLAEWEALPATQRRAAVVTWIQQKRLEKGGAQ